MIFIPLMCCFDEEPWEKIPELHRNAIMEEYHAFEQGLVKSGHYRAGAKLGSSSTATAVRVKNGKAATADGPFAETKEQIGGYHIAMRIPTLTVGGSVEVRPVENAYQG